MKWLLLMVLVVGGCRAEQISESKREIWRDGKKTEDITETLRINAHGGKLIQRFHTLAGEVDAVESLAQIDENGLATGASYRREGPKGKRYVELRRFDEGSDFAKKHPDDLARYNGKLVLFSRGDDEVVVLPERPIVVLDVLHHLKAKNLDVTLVDVENATAVPAHVDASGALSVAVHRVEIAAGERAPATATATSARVLSHDDPVLPAHSVRAPFIEAQAPVVVKWCKQQTSADAGVLDAAKAVALAIKPKLAADRAGGPPSALWAVKIGGYDDDGAALEVACMRALGHPARVVTGSVAGVTSARTWAQVHDGKAWLDVDPTDIELDGTMKLEHEARFEGFRGPLAE